MKTDAEWAQFWKDDRDKQRHVIEVHRKHLAECEEKVAALEAENDELREEVNRQEEHINGLADTRLKIEQENERLREEAKRISRIRDHHYRHQAMDAALKEAEDG